MTIKPKLQVLYNAPNSNNNMLRTIHAERKWKRKISLIFIVYSLILFFLFFDLFTFAWYE